MQKVESKNIHELDRVSGGRMEYDFGFPLAIHLGAQYEQKKNISANWYGLNPATKVHYYSWLPMVGIKAYFPFPVVQPWVGFDIALGSSTLSNPNDRTFSNYLSAVADKGTVFAASPVSSAGVDVMIGGFGFRGTFAYEPVSTSKNLHIAWQKYNLRYLAYSFGVVFEYGRSKK